MKAKDADRLGTEIAAHINAGQLVKAYTLLAPILSERTPFRLLDRIGNIIGQGELEAVNDFIEEVSMHRREGGWVIIGSALGAQLDRDFEGAFVRCQYYIRNADIWYATDILGERVPGPALLSHFQESLTMLSPWRDDEDHWIRRAIGVAIHFWAKRSRGAIQHTSRAEALLAFLEPLFGEGDIDAVKGIGWGLKTLGRVYPGLVTPWLIEQVAKPKQCYRALMLKKALTYLSPEQRTRVEGTLH